MHTYLPALADQSVPRYTSYPTADRFHTGVGPTDQRRALDAIESDEPISLYVHIPYCRKICWYCGCNTQALGRGERLIRYLDALEREIAAVSRRVRGRVHSIHWGGGSPNALTPAMFASLSQQLRKAFKCIDDPEIAVELDPRLIEPDFVEALARAGTSRASLGVQTFADHVQRAIGRFQPVQVVKEAVTMLRDAGIDAINIDLLYGLPRQELADIEDTIGTAVALHPHRIALFGYAHIPDMLSRQRAIDPSKLPAAEARFWQSAYGHDRLIAAGYGAIGFDHFALPHDPLAVAAAHGTLRRNFQGFTADPTKTVIGLGASAISQFDGLLAQNHKDAGSYRTAVFDGGWACGRGMVRTLQDRLRGELIERLLCNGVIDIGAAEQRHGMLLPDRDRVEANLALLAEQGLVCPDRGYWILTPAGRPYARLAATIFDPERSAAMRALVPSTT